MRCVYCGSRAGLFRRLCGVCARVVAVIDKTAGQVGLTAMVDLFVAEGLTRAQVDRVLDARVGGQPTLRDRLTSEMANALMRGLGMPGRQSPEDVRRVRLAMESGNGAGSWSSGEKPPETP